MKKVVSYFLALILAFNSNIKIGNASEIEKGNPAAHYSYDGITLPNGVEVDLNEEHILLFLNGTFISDYEVLIRDDLPLIPISLIAQELGASVDWKEVNKTIIITKQPRQIVLTMDSSTASVNGNEIDLDYPVTIYEDLSYVPLSFVSENLDATVHQSLWESSEYSVYYDTGMPVSSPNTIVRTFDNIIIDEKYDFSDSITAEAAMKKTQAICTEGLENFSKHIKENLANLNEDSEHLDKDFLGIKKEIDRMLYIGEVSRFYKFTIGPYDILYDRINNKIFFVIYSSNTIVKEVDVNDTSLYIPVFIVG